MSGKAAVAARARLARASELLERTRVRAPITGRVLRKFLDVGSVVSFGYYGNVMRVMYLDEPARLPAVSVGADQAVGIADTVAEFAVATLAFLVLALGVVPFLLGFDFLSTVLAVL